MTSLLTTGPAATDSSGNGALGGIVLMLGLAIAIGLYFLPTAIAVMRGHHQLGAIIAINTFLGCLLVGWVVALAMALSAKREPTVHQTIYQQPPQHPGPGYPR